MKVAFKEEKLVLAIESPDRARCPACGEPVMAKVGGINAPHWAHFPSASCTHGASMTLWHYHVQLIAVRDHGYRFEQAISGDPRGFRADLVAPSGLVIELQTDPLDGYEADEREDFHSGNPLGMIWLFRGKREYHRNARMRDLNCRAYCHHWEPDGGDEPQADKPVSTFHHHSSTNWTNINEFLAWAARWTPDHLLPGGRWRRGIWSVGEDT